MSVKKQFLSIRKLLTNSTNSILFDIAQILRDAVGALLWKDKRGLWTAISGACNDYSRDVFDKIQNLTRNIVDIDCCDIHSLKSIASSVNASYLTDFINLNYPLDIIRLINLFSVKLQIIFDSFISDYAKTAIIGTIDNRSKDVFKLANYSKLLFYSILLNLDNIRYLLETLNNIDFNLSIWSYISSIKNRGILYTSFSSFIENDGINPLKYSAPSLNKVFQLLNYIKTDFLKKYNILKNNIFLSENNINTKYTINYRLTFRLKYLGNISNILITKDFIISKCSEVQYYKSFSNIKSDKTYENDVIFGWNPYPLMVINNISLYKLYNNLNLTLNILFLNPFLVLIAVLKNIIYDVSNNKRLKLTYEDNKSNLTIDLSYIILNCVQTVLNDTTQFYKLMIVFHFYGLFYDMIINDHLKLLWNVYTQNNLIITQYVGKYSLYSKQLFLDKLPKYIKNLTITLFILNGPIYYNQYHLDFLIYLSIVNNSIQDLKQAEFSSIITRYNNNFDNTDIKNFLYNLEKRRLLGLVLNNKFYDTIDLIGLKKFDSYLDINSSILYYIAKKFANYCNKIRATRESIKLLIQKYARIGTTQVILNIIELYFYKQLNTYSKIKNLKLASLDLTNNNEKLAVELIEYYDTTNYMNILALLPQKIVSYLNGKILTSVILTSGSTPTSYFTTYVLPNDVMSSNAGLKDIIRITDLTADFRIVLSNLDFDYLISTPRPIENYCPQIAVVSTYSIAYNGTNKTEYCNCTFYNTNGYNNELSSNWTVSDLPTVTSLITTTTLANNGNLAFVSSNFLILNNHLDLSSIYLKDSILYRLLLESLNLSSTDSVSISDIIEIKDSVIIPSGSVVKKLRNDVLTYNYHTIISSGMLQIPIYSKDIPSGTYNYKFWNYNNLTDTDKENIFDKQIIFWEKYFPLLKNAISNLTKQLIYKLKIYPFLSSIMDLHAVSDFSGLFAEMQKLYAGNLNGSVVTKNITNTIFPTIASVPNISNLILKSEITTENNLYVNLYLNSFFTNIEKESLNILNSLINGLQISNNSMFGYPASAWYYCYTTFTGYNSVYGQTTNINLSTAGPDKHIDIDGPWIYDVLSYFVKLYYNNKLTISLTDNNFFNSLYLPLNLSNPILLSSTIEKYSTLNTYFLSYLNILNFITQKCNFIQLRNKLLKLKLLLFFYQKDIIKKSKYSIYNYKEDMFGNSLTLFKHSLHNNFLDCGLIWIRLKNNAFSYPLTWCRLIAELLYYDEDICDIFKISVHNRYANLIKQMTNNALDFGIYDNNIWILGRTNYIILNSKLIKKDKMFLSLYVFLYNYDSHKNEYYINLKSLKNVNIHRDSSYLKTINNFVCAYNNYKEKTINFILYDVFSMNKQLSDKYKELSQQIVSLLKDIIINLYLHLDNIDLNLIKASYNVLTHDLLNDDTILMKHATYPICGLFNSRQLINHLKYKAEIGYNLLNYTKSINLIFDLIKYSNKQEFSLLNIANFIANFIIKSYDGLHYYKILASTKFSLIKSLINKNIQVNYLNNEHKYLNNILTVSLEDSVISTLESIYYNNKELIYIILLLTDDKKKLFLDLMSWFRIDNILFDNKNNYHLILDFIGHKIKIFKKKNILNSLTYNALFPLLLFALTNITYNNYYKSVDILFGQITLAMNKKLHEDCSDEQRNVISYHYNIDNDSMSFSGKICVSNLLTLFFKLQNDLNNYIFKIEPFYDCLCNILNYTYGNVDKKLYLTKNVFDNNLTKEEYIYISSLILADSLIYDNGNIYIKLLAVNLNISNLDYLNYLTFTYNSDIHVYLYFGFNGTFTGKMYYKAFYIDKNTKYVKSKIIGLRKYIHKSDCERAIIKEQLQHVWKANVNQDTLYIGYLSINTSIENLSTFYKNLYFNLLDLVYIDTITILASIVKKRINENLYVNVVEDIKLYYGYDVALLPFTFRLLSALLVPQLEYTYVDGIITFKHNPLNLEFVLSYGNELNRIHNKYPKYEITDNKIKCTTILTKLGGIKNFSNDISTNKNLLLYLINYIFYSSFKKKKDILLNHVYYIANSIFNLLTVSDSVFCVNDFLFNLKQVKTLNSDIYFDYDLEAGFGDIIQLLNKSDLILNKNRLVIDNINVLTYLRQTDTYKNMSSVINVEDYLLVAAALKNDPLDILNNGFLYKFYASDLEYVNGTQESKLYLAFLKAMPSFGLSFNDNLKINVNFGLMDSRIKQFITGALSFDLDISCYINDAKINGTLHLKKVGWNCGYLKTDYIEWLTGDNRYGGPLVLLCNISKYNNYLYYQYVTSLDSKKPRYKHELYNSIAKDVKIHLEVCWYNLSMIIALKPYVDIYWKGYFKRIVVDGKKLSYNKKCCLDSWGYDISLDLRNMIILYEANNKLYPVLTTEMDIEKLYNIYVTQDKNKILSWQLQDTTNYLPTIKNNNINYMFTLYKQYNLTLRNLILFCNRLLLDSNALQSIVDEFSDNISRLNNLLIIEYIAHASLNLGTDNIVEYNKKTKYRDVQQNIKYITANLAEPESTDLSYFNIIKRTIVKSDLSIDKNTFNTIMTKFLNVLNLAEYILFLYDFCNVKMSLLTIYIKYSNLLNNIELTIELYENYTPSIFYYYYTNTDEYLNNFKSQFYYPNLYVPLTGLVEYMGALHEIYSEDSLLSGNIKFIDLSSTSGFILFYEKNGTKISRNIVITNLKKLVNTNDSFDMTVLNYNSINNILQLYLKLVLIVDTEGGLINLYNFDNINHNYIPDPDNTITPYIRYFIKNKSIDLLLLNLPDGNKYKETGFIFDNNISYDNVIYNVMTNNIRVEYNTKIDNYIMHSDDLNLNLTLSSQFELKSLILYGIQELINNDIIPNELMRGNFEDMVLVSGIIYDYNNELFKHLSATVKMEQYQNIKGKLQRISSLVIGNNICTTFSAVVPSGLYKFIILTDTIHSNLVCNSDRFQICSGQTVECKLNLLEYAYPLVSALYSDIGYNIELYKLNSSLKFEKISNLSCQIDNNNISLNIYSYNVASSIISSKEDYYYEIVNYNNTSRQLNINIPTVLNVGILKLLIKPFYNLRHTTHLMNSNKTIISNYYNLFTTALSGLNIAEDKKYILSNNKIALVDTVLNNLLIYHNFNDLLTNGRDLKISFKMDISNIYPLTYRILLDNSIISGYSSNVEDFIYLVSAYYNTFEYSYLIGIISGYYFYKDIVVENIYKDNKTDFMFTTNMTLEQISGQLSGNNIISSNVYIPSNNDVIININGMNYYDTDFMNIDLADITKELKKDN